MTKIELEIKGVSINTGHGPDLIIMRTSLPYGCWPYGGDQSVEMIVAAGTGEQYVRKHFPNLQYEVIQRPA